METTCRPPLTLSRVFFPPYHDSTSSQRESQPYSSSRSTQNFPKPCPKYTTINAHTSRNLLSKSCCLTGLGEVIPVWKMVIMTMTDVRLPSIHVRGYFRCQRLVILVGTCQKRRILTRKLGLQSRCVIEDLWTSITNDAQDQFLPAFSTNSF